MGILDATQVSRRTTDSLDKMIIEVAAQDLLTTLRYVAAEAIGEQILIGNKPTSLVVDGRGGKPIDQAERRVQAFFADTAIVYQAVLEAWQKTIELTKSRTGKGVSTYQLWFREQFVGTSPEAARKYIEKFNPATDYFRIVGPVIAYGRKLYWSPKGTPRFTKHTLFRGTALTVKIVRIRGIMNLVEQSLRRKFRAIAIAEDWVVTSALPKDGRTPGLWIGFKRRGNLTSSAYGPGY